MIIVMSFTGGWLEYCNANEVMLDNYMTVTELVMYLDDYSTRVADKYPASQNRSYFFAI